MWKVYWWEGKSEDIGLGGVWELGLTWGPLRLAGCMDLGRAFIGQMELTAQDLFSRVLPTAYGAMYQGKVLTVRVSWQRGTLKDVNVPLLS